jgi:hypothetical protein
MNICNDVTTKPISWSVKISSQWVTEQDFPDFRRGSLFESDTSERTICFNQTAKNWKGNWTEHWILLLKGSILTIEYDGLFNLRVKSRQYLWLTPSCPGFVTQISLRYINCHQWSYQDTVADKFVTAPLEYFAKLKQVISRDILNKSFNLQLSTYYRSNSGQWFRPKKEQWKICEKQVHA